MDWDEDGDYDLISGEYYGYVTLFRNIGSATDPVLTDEGHIMASGSDIDVGSLSTPTVNDWDEDGRKDLVIGCSTGYVYVYLNTGTDKVPAFGGSFMIQADGASIVKAKNYPKVADLNEDGLKDLVMGWLDGICLFWPNYGTNADPLFYESYELVGFTDPVDPGPGVYNWSHLEVCDWNDDGYPDLLYTRWESEIFIHLNALGLLGVTVEPLDPPVVIPPGGGSFTCKVTVTNISSETAVIDGWDEAMLPSGSLYGPVTMMEDVVLVGGDTRQFNIRRSVPGVAPSGMYSFGVYIGQTANGYFVSDGFRFEKE